MERFASGNASDHGGQKVVSRVRSRESLNQNQRMK
jgi:hypothetical protein